MKRFAVAALLALAALSAALAGCSFSDDEARTRLDALEARANDSEVELGTVTGRVNELEDWRSDQEQVVNDLAAEVEAQAHERRYEAQHEEIWEAALAAARCYVSSDPSAGRNYPNVAPEQLVETVAGEMYDEYRLMLTEGGMESSRILEVLGALQLPCGS